MFFKVLSNDLYLWTSSQWTSVDKMWFALDSALHVWHEMAIVMKELKWHVASVNVFSMLSEGIVFHLYRRAVHGLNAEYKGDFLR